MPVDTSALKAAFQQYLCDAMDAAVQDEIIPAMRDAAQENTGAMKAGIHADPASTDGQIVSTTIYSDAEYSSFMDQGTRDHDIFGNPFLAFYWQKIGQFVVLPYVHHPGTVGSGFFTETMADHFISGLNYGLDAASLG